ncbi:MAG: hypothetical protein KJ072_09200 [Verrucomicrobia bacterium]|nr:hypothetical protein [Verrucomicrobiota bacterium]
MTVTLKTGRDIHIRHDSGIGNIDISDLDDEVKSALGYVVENKETAQPGEAGKFMPAEWANLLPGARGGSRETVGGGGQMPFEIPMVLSPMVIAVVFAIGLLFHLFFSYCSRLICIKAGREPGFMVWLPVLQIYPMFRAAGMSGWWILGLLVPVLNLVVQILWCIKIVNARGKHVIWAILLILPLVNLVAFLYLAFSSDNSSQGSVGFPAFSPRPA